MIVYYSILAYLLYLGVMKKLCEKYEKSDSVIVAIAVLILFVFAAMRSVNVGADTRQYCGHFSELAQTPWLKLPAYESRRYGTLELGYKVMNKLLAVFREPQTITIVNSILQIGLIAIVIYRQSKDKWLSIFLYFSFCFYQTALNLTPSSYVSYFMFLTFPFIKDKKLIKFLIMIGIGMLFHTSAVFFLPLYFLSKVKFNKKTFTVGCIVSVLIFLFYSVFIQIITAILPQKYIHYIDNTKERTGNTIELLVLVVQLVALVFCYMQLEKDKKSSVIQENNLVVWMLFYEIILYLLSMIAPMFQRGAFLFSPYFIIIIPNLISKISDERRRQWVTVGMTVYGTALYILRVSINNVGTTMPYEFFFNR
ncbi:MAG: EpsG family protein [Clostridia bacterium]|nr:EpsG family protein [Clostridia bacterium]